MQPVPSEVKSEPASLECQIFERHVDSVNSSVPRQGTAQDLMKELAERFPDLGQPVVDFAIYEGSSKVAIPADKPLASLSLNLVQVRPHAGLHQVADFLDFKDALQSLSKSGQRLGYATLAVNEKQCYEGYRETDLNEEEEEMDGALDELREKLGKMYSSGSIVLDEERQGEDKLEIRTEEGWVSAGSLMQPDLETLLAHSKRSGFGDLKTNTTRYDDSVRKASEILGEHVRINHKGKHFTIPEWLADLPAEMRPRFPLACTLDGAKLNFYGVGGHFEAHVDTPRPGTVATVVIGLPCLHKDGELWVGKRLFPQLFQLGQPGQLTWVAFYSDCQHGIKEVTAGHRLTFTLPLTAYIADEAASDAPKRRVQDAIGRFPGPLGFLLRHCYTQLGLQPAHLKGADRELWEAVLATGREASLRHVVAEYEELTVCEHTPEMKTVVYAFDIANLQALLYGEKSAELAKPTTELPSSSKALEQPAAGGPENLANPNYPFFGQLGGTCLSYDSQEKAEWTGNEALDGSVEAIYFQAAILVEEQSKHKL